MASVNLRNLNIIHSKDNYVGQAFDDVVTALSDLKTQVASLQALVAQLQKKVG